QLCRVPTEEHGKRHREPEPGAARIPEAVQENYRGDKRRDLNCKPDNHRGCEGQIPEGPKRGKANRWIEADIDLEELTGRGQWSGDFSQDMDVVRALAQRQCPAVRPKAEEIPVT